MADDPVVARIDALLRKAESSEFPEERDAFYAKAAALMRRYAIDQAAIDEHRADRDPPGHETWVYSLERDHLDGKRLLLTLACEVAGSGTRGGFTAEEGRNGEQMCVIFGFPAERTVTRLSYLSLVNVARDEAHRRGYTSPSMVETFTVGFATALFDRLRDERLAAEAPGAPGALVLVDRSAQVEEITPDAPDIEVSGEHRDTAAHARGYAAGQFADVDLDTRRRIE